MTYVINKAEDFPAEALAGFAAAHPQYVTVVHGGVVRSTDTPPGQPALVIGGGSGHYPAFAGWIGPGLGHGSPCGNIFSSPSSSQVYSVARSAENGGGVILGFGNYAGDVLHFGAAAEKLRAEGVEVRIVMVSDDVASNSAENHRDRRGIAGDLPVFKIAGAAIEAGAGLDEAERVAWKANDATRSLGVAFDGCTLPGADAPLFTVPEGTMSLGLGIHGEPGISDLPHPTASELADLLVSRLLADVPDDAGARVAVIVNGLGSVKYDELFLLFGKVERLLVAAGLEVVDPECGELVTSLDMAGLSVTLFWLDDELERYWSAPADSPAFRKGVVSARAPRARDDVEAAAVASHVEASAASVSLGAVAAELLGVMRDVVIQNEQDLGDLDAIAGDGDHGIGMRRGVDAAAEAARASTAHGAGAREVLIAAGEAWAERAGGTSGALWGAALEAVAQTIGNRESYTAQDAVEGAAAFRDALTTLGKADLGDKTMVDAVVPFVDAIAAAVAEGAHVPDAFAAAAASAVRAAELTSDLIPLRGRARPLAERSLGHPDPGAVSFGLLATGVAEYLANTATVASRTHSSHANTED